MTGHQADAIGLKVILAAVAVVLNGERLAETGGEGAALAAHLDQLGGHACDPRSRNDLDACAGAVDGEEFGA